jgi:hypothetical protein
MNRLGWIVAGVLALAVVALAAGVVRGGPLDPLGTPGPTDSVRVPGTPISTLPFPINASGNYYLTRSLTGNSGITINASDVTLDLGGFTLDGTGSGYGIDDGGSARSNVVVRNGTVRDWNIGVYLQQSVRSSLHDLHVVGNGKGIIIGAGGMLAGLTVRENGSGIEIIQGSTDWGTVLAGSIISKSSFGAIFVAANNVWIHDNAIDATTGTGVYLSGSSSWNQVTDNRIVGASEYGVRIGTTGSGANVNTVARNVFMGTGILAVLDEGAGNRVGIFAVDGSLSATNPWSNVVY